ncbi:ribosome small subunit-dependent GTPase A [Spirochaetota bacterium]
MLARDGQVYRCNLKSKKLKGAEGFYNPLAAGDVVEWEEASPGTGLIVGLGKRKNLFWRYNEKGKAIQAIAANMDLLVCVASTALPPFRPRFIDRVSLEPASEKIPFLVILNKTDLGVDKEVRDRMADYRHIGFDTLFLSVKNNEGLAELSAMIRGKTSAFVGQSGVGKSSILNAIEPGLGLRVGEVCEKYERGRHTTVAALMSVLADGNTRVIDTPGFRRLAVRGLDPATLSACFPEMTSLLSHCALGARCMHIDEDGCAVKKAVEDGGIHDDRYESYLRIFSELSEEKQYGKKRGNPRKNIFLADEDDEA